MIDEIIDKNSTIISSSLTNIKYKFKIPIETQNGFGTVHGGFTFSLFEGLAKRALLHYNTKLKKDDIVTIKASTNYLESLASDSNIIIDIIIDKSSKTLFIVTINAYQENSPKKLSNTSNIILKINNTKF
jgi:acyl-coenzyme A thioesterase PaaI-like protein